MPNLKLRGDSTAVASKETIIEHLGELRKVLIFCVVAIIVGFIVVFVAFSERLLVYLSQPLLNLDIQIINIGVAEPFIAQMKVSFIAGCVVASPAVFWKIWSFLRPALFPKERVKFLVMFFIILLLFIMGVLFAYFLVLSLAINFFITSGENIATPMISLNMYIDMLFRFVLPFGLAFEFPVVVFVLHKFGIVTLGQLKKARKYVLFGMFVLATLLTPPDLISQIMLAVPMYILYEISIFVLRFMSRSKEKQDEPAV